MKRKADQLSPGPNGRPFIAATRPLEKGHHGGWEGTFAARHGGFPHMFENLAPSKSKRWLGQTDTKAVSALPVLVPYASKGGPGYPHRAIATDEPYMSDANHDAVERLNRQLRLGDGDGFRPPASRAAVPWMTAPARGGAFDGMAPYRSAPPPAPSEARRRDAEAARERAGRAAHAAPFVAAGREGRRAGEGFGRYPYVGEPFVDDTYAQFDRMVTEGIRRRERAAGRPPLAHPPLRLSALAAHWQPSPSIMFRRR